MKEDDEAVGMAGQVIAWTLLVAGTAVTSFAMLMAVGMSGDGCMSSCHYPKAFGLGAFLAIGVPWLSVLGCIIATVVRSKRGQDYSMVPVIALLVAIATFLVGYSLVTSNLPT